MQNDPALTAKAGLSAGPVRTWVAIRLGRAKTQLARQDHQAILSLGRQLDKIIPP